MNKKNEFNYAVKDIVGEENNRFEEMSKKIESLHKDIISMKCTQKTISYFLFFITTIFLSELFLTSNIVKENTKYTFRYYEQFINYINDHSEIKFEDNNFSKKEYLKWYNNEGYGDIIVDYDGSLISIYELEDPAY